MEKSAISEIRLGILGGGQLGKMLTLAASTWDVRTSVLDRGADMPAASVCGRFVDGDFRDEETVYRFGKEVDLLTIEIEQVNLDALERLEREGARIEPAPAVLRIIQDKYLQNRFLSENGFPKAEYRAWESLEEILAAVKKGTLAVPFVQKLRKFGYDGRGVKVVKTAADLEDLLPGPTITEDLVPIAKEISVIAARNAKGETSAFQPVEMVFEPAANLVDFLLCPAEISARTAEEASRLAVDVITRLGMRGILAVEMFLDRDGRLWVNELAPRPHNSGHHTIESCVTSQYEQHLRAVLNFPLGSTRLKMPSLMLNLLGAPGYSGPARYDGLAECLAIEGVKIHIYGKKETRPYRKMGHVTILDQDLNRAREKADLVRKTLRVIA